MPHDAVSGKADFSGEYEPSRAAWVRDQVAAYEASGGQRANTLRDTGLPVVIVTMRGNKTGKIRKIALMRVEHEGSVRARRVAGRCPQAPVLVPQPDGRPARPCPGRAPAGSDDGPPGDGR